MFPVRRLYDWVRLSPSPSGMLTIVAVASAVTFGWVGWEMLRQESAAEEQRERERLENRADRVVQTIERVLSEVDQQLDDRIAAPRGGLATTSEGLVLVFDQQSIRPVSPSVLVFYPVLSAQPEPPESLFAAAEADEFQRHSLGEATDAYRRLARSPDRAVRAASLVRLARVLRRLNRGDAALEVYREIAGLEGVQVVGAPAALVARDAEMRLLAQLGRHEAAEGLARKQQHDLATGRWAVTSGQYEHYAAEAARISGREIPLDHRLAAAHAVADFWRAWQAAPSPRGRLLFGPAGERHFVAWRSIGAVSAAWVAPLDQLLAHVPVEARQGISLIEGKGDSPGLRDRAHMSVARTSADTGLPFSIQATARGAPAQYKFISRSRLVVAALTVMLAFLLAASYFIGRAVRREVALARLQADFVSAVSHEFRTPLASMRQLSELLAAGRVPFEGRRQQYYESLAAESQRLQRLVENLLEFGKLEAGPRPYHIEPVDPRSLMESAVTDFLSQLGRSDCRIEVSGGKVEAPVLADRNAITLVLHNLLDNAVKYSGGRSVRLCCEPEGDRIAFSVIDEGPGISAEDQHRIFQKFVRGRLGRRDERERDGPRAGDGEADCFRTRGRDPRPQPARCRQYLHGYLARTGVAVMTHILIVEDEPIIAGALQDDLSLEGYDVTVIGDGAAGAKYAIEHPVDLIVLDVMLPSRDGVDVCRDLRRAGLKTPILMLTARVQEAEKILAFESGADDYVTKPFGTKELRARIKALLRRAGNGRDRQPDVFEFADVQVDFTRGEVRRGGEPLDLTLTEFKLLGAFVRNQGRVLNRQQLLDAASGVGTFVSDRTIDNHIVNLRRKIERVPTEPTHIVSVRGLGYRFDV